MKGSPAAALEALKREVMRSRREGVASHGLLAAATRVVVALDEGFAAVTTRWRVLPDGGCASRKMDGQGDLFRCELPGRHVGQDHEGAGWRWCVTEGWDLPFPDDEPVRNGPPDPLDEVPRRGWARPWRRRVRGRPRLVR